MEKEEQVKGDEYISFYVNEKTGKVLIRINDFSYSQIITDIEFNRKHYKLRFYEFFYHAIILSIALIIINSENYVYFLIPYLFSSSALKLFEYNKATTAAIDLVKTIKSTSPKP